ncbi:solute carrier family 35 member F6-like [Varroa jacobsoni]|uniref:solute carrier family 35 member F6-like n=1 Tax=Varroa jacobsoni TaxID=62625 RepID=UPI000BF28D07|nr:solute carrier family 35 member F6-like [Varroa jacobsoni]XP_022700356.1 solute carrier family 35 member F6-like [Varroa jacobsoni]XP_022700357.1 solute carrier family 35 member F6-like [Varroa jacobsoni]
MAWSGHQLFLAGLLVFTGSINTLATKWADMAVVSGSPYGHLKNGSSTTIPHPFSHSFLQALGMFFGEFICLVTFKVLLYLYSSRVRDSPEASKMPSILKGNRNFNPYIFIPPVLCDMIGTTVMYIGLNMTYASSAQMLRGAVIIFTGLLSILLLRRRLFCFQWTGILIVLAGLTIVGCADMFFGSKKHIGNTPDAAGVTTGDLLIIAAQLITALQMVLEEKFIVGHNVPPLQVVGLEGFFGMIGMILLLIPLYFIKVGGVPIEDTVDGIYQIYNSYQVAIGYFGTVLSISFYNFAGVSVTKELSATTRMVLDSLRAIFIWVFCLFAQWQNFTVLTIIGFAIMLIGMMLYNNVLIMPFLVSHGCVADPFTEENEEDRQQLADEENP